MVFVAERRTTKFLPMKQYHIVPGCGLVYRDYKKFSTNWPKIHCSRNFTPQEIPAIRYTTPFFTSHFPSSFPPYYTFLSPSSLPPSLPSSISLSPLPPSLHPSLPLTLSPPSLPLFLFLPYPSLPPTAVSRINSSQSSLLEEVSYLLMSTRD